jgi:hypothetical protein
LGKARRLQLRAALGSNRLSPQREPLALWCAFSDDNPTTTNACASCYYHGTRGYRAHRAPGIPCALIGEGGK